jgi:hypothetical protein
MEKVESTRNDRDSKRFIPVFHGLGLILLAVLLIAGSGIKEGLITLFAYVPLYFFIRYLQRHR